MPNAHYTRLRGWITHFRRRLPAGLRKKLASSEICIKLGVISTNDAHRLGRRLAGAQDWFSYDSFFEDANVNPMLDGTALIKRAEQTINGWRANDASSAVENNLDFTA